MAIIKCPECGHSISDKAPMCPNCGVEIAGKVIKCRYCGEYYFKTETSCPHCHNEVAGTLQKDQSDAQQPEVDVQAHTSTYMENSPEHGNANNNRRKNNKTVIIISAIIAVLIVGIALYAYNKAQGNKEMEEYNIAMNSNDPMVLQMYLDNFKDAPQAHIDSISAHLQRIKLQDQDWTDAVVSGSKTALLEYIKTHPNSPYEEEALAKIDSIDWELCKKTNTAEAYQAYIDGHATDKYNHYEEAMIALKKIKLSEVSIDERQAISNIFHNFFLSINTKDENSLTANVSDFINFLGKQDATKNDVVSFMHKLYKIDVESMMWGISGNYDIGKKEIGDEQYEYNTTFTAKQKIKKTDGTEVVNTYRINAKINPDWKITEMSMTKIVE